MKEFNVRTHSIRSFRYFLHPIYLRFCGDIQSIEKHIISKPQQKKKSYLISQLVLFYFHYFAS